MTKIEISCLVWHTSYGACAISPKKDNREFEELQLEHLNRLSAFITKLHQLLGIPMQATAIKIVLQVLSIFKAEEASILQ